MRTVLFLFLLSLVAPSCSCWSPQLDPNQVYERTQNGLLFTQRCQAATQKAMSECEGSAAADCRSNVQEAQNDCSGAAGVFSAIADVSAAAGAKANK